MIKYDQKHSNILLFTPIKSMFQSFHNSFINCMYLLIHNHNIINMLLY